MLPYYWVLRKMSTELDLRAVAFEFWNGVFFQFSAENRQKRSNSGFPTPAIPCPTWSLPGGMNGTQKKHKKPAMAIYGKLFRPLVLLGRSAAPNVQAHWAWNWRDILTDLCSCSDRIPIASGGSPSASWLDAIERIKQQKWVLHFCYFKTRVIWIRLSLITLMGTAGKI